MMPIAWTKTYTGSAGKTARVFATTLGSSEDLLTEANRRLLVNACYWALGLERQIKPNANVGAMPITATRPSSHKLPTIPTRYPG